MRRWIERFRSESQSGQESEGRGGTQPFPALGSSTLELLVLEGADAGGRYTIDGEQVAIGRGAAQKGQVGAICLSDPTVSPRQAMLYTTPEGVSIEHRQGTTNPTLVNGDVVDRRTIGPGDRIQMGRTVFEVRSRPGIALSGLFRAPTQALPGSELTREIGESSTTEVRAVDGPRASLVLVDGIAGHVGRRFPVSGLCTSLGRHPSSDVLLPEKGVSRRHADLIWERSDLVLVHRSATNPTYVDGEVVTEQRVLTGGETIQLADRVVLRLEMEQTGAAPSEARPPSRARAEPSLEQMMEEKIRRDEEIERDFGFRGSFLDIDVVDSHGLKVHAERPEHIVVSFERFRRFARRVVEEFEGQVLNSNGDELMCFFDAPLQAVRAASAMLVRLAEFNERENLLSDPFRVRQGIHTGKSLVDRVHGVAYSPLLDVAGHLQKHSPANGLLVSEQTLAELPEGLPFVPGIRLEKDGVQTHRLEGVVD